MWEMHWHQIFYKCFFLFSFVDNTSLLCWCFKLSSLYSSLIFFLSMDFILSTQYYLSSLDVSIESLRSSSALFLNYLYQGRNLANRGGILWYLFVPKMVISWFWIVYIFCGNIGSDFIFFLFIGMHFLGLH